jgi:hypothetical protein
MTITRLRFALILAALGSVLLTGSRTIARQPELVTPAVEQPSPSDPASELVDPPVIEPPSSPEAYTESQPCYGGCGNGCVGNCNGCCNGGCGCAPSCGPCASPCFGDCCKVYSPSALVDPRHVFPTSPRGVSFRGWLDAGILGNTSNPMSGFNGPYNSQQVDNGQFNQAYLIAERALTKGYGIDLGGRFDLLYGSDFLVAQSNGLEKNPSGSARWNSSQFYGLALPQAYLEAGNTNASVKAGHFYSIVGYEGVQAVNNFFYSHAYSYQFAGPFTHWGGLGTWKPYDNLQFQAGIINGWNSLDNGVNKGAFMGGVKYTSDVGRWWSSFAIVTGDEQNNPAGLATVTNQVANRTRYSFIVSKQIGCRAEYVFHQWLGSQATGAPGGGTALWYGIDQYLYYRLSPKWRVGTRVEWFRDEEGTRVGLSVPSNPNKPPLPGSYGSWTVGGNWQPIPNVVIRPELRWDTYAGSAFPYADGSQKYQLLLGTDAIVQF